MGCNPVCLYELGTSIRVHCFMHPVNPTKFQTVGRKPEHPGGLTTPRLGNRSSILGSATHLNYCAILGVIKKKSIQLTRMFFQTHFSSTLQVGPFLVPSVVSAKHLLSLSRRCPVSASIGPPVIHITDADTVSGLLVKELKLSSVQIGESTGQRRVLAAAR